MATPAPKVEKPKAIGPATASRSHRPASAALADNRPAAVAQRQLQEKINQSLRVQQAAALQARIAQSPRQQQAAQRMAAAPAQRNSNQTGLPDALKAGVENLSGYSLDDVRVHYNSAKPAQLQAHAYAQGTDVHIAPGQEKQLPHEAWHVVQQKQGRVWPTMQLKGEANLMEKNATQFPENRPADGAQMITQEPLSNSSIAEPLSADSLSIGAGPQKEPTEANSNGADGKAGKSLSTYFVEKQEAIDISGETHHLKYRLVNGEFVLGVASSWKDISNIHDALQNLAVSEEWKKLWKEFTSARNARMKAELRVDNAENKERTAKNKKTSKQSIGYGMRSLIKSPELAKGIVLRNSAMNAINRQERAANAFIHLSAREFPTEVSQILGENMPPIAYDSDVSITDNGKVRYHTGESNDPIPFTWYKPATKYLDFKVNDYSAFPVRIVTLKPFAAKQTVKTPDKKAHTFGVDAANRIAIGTVLKNTPQHGSDRKSQQKLNATLLALGFDMKKSNLDGDHVKDLGFDGRDVVENFWPLDSVINRLAFNGWRSTYYLNYKTGEQDLAGDKKVEKAPLNSGTLTGKYFKVVAESATASPAGNKTSASGSSTAWGTKETIADKTGATITEA